jgi:Aspartyl/Asparaginyl beta-hydroxylase
MLGTYQPANVERLACGISISEIRSELSANRACWNLDNGRQLALPHQKDTQAIHLRGVPKPFPKHIAIEEVETSIFLELSQTFPQTVSWLNRFAKESEGILGKVMFAKLPSGGSVFPHIDYGKYYRERQRFHLVIYSGVGNVFSCGDQTVVMKEGEIWTVNNKCTHSAYNGSGQDRVHLIFDTKV